MYWYEPKPPPKTLTFGGTMTKAVLLSLPVMIGIVKLKTLDGELMLAPLFWLGWTIAWTLASTKSLCLALLLAASRGNADAAESLRKTLMVVSLLACAWNLRAYQAYCHGLGDSSWLPIAIYVVVIGFLLLSTAGCGDPEDLFWHTFFGFFAYQSSLHPATIAAVAAPVLALGLTAAMPSLLGIWAGGKLSQMGGGR